MFLIIVLNRPLSVDPWLLWLVRRFTEFDISQVPVDG